MLGVHRKQDAASAAQEKLSENVMKNKPSLLIPT